MFSIRSCVISSIGKNRDNHEDNFVFAGRVFLREDDPRTPDVNCKDLIVSECYQTLSDIYAVFDGIGGYDYGEMASEISAENLIRHRNELLNDQDGCIDRFQQYIEDTNRLLIDFSKKNHCIPNIGTTISALILFENIFYVFNLGDSRIYRYNEEGLFQITRDHNERIRSIELFGNITYPDIFAERLTRHLGIDIPGMKVKADAVEMDYSYNKEFFILCTDGFYKSISDDILSKTLNRCFVSDTLVDTATELVKEASEKSEDNITLILLSVERHEDDE